MGQVEAEILQFQPPEALQKLSNASLYDFFKLKFPPSYISIS